MNTTELRQGNLVYWNVPEKDGVPHIVTRISRGYIQTAPISTGSSINDYRPIPFTEDWILKAGYEENQFIGFQKGFSDGSQVYIQKMACNVVTAFIRGDDAYVFIGEIKYVHQFQNAYFAINKREATFTGISKYII